MKSKWILLVLPATLLSACSDNDPPASAVDPSQVSAVVSTRSSDYGSGAVSLVNAAPPFATQNGLNATISDIGVRADGDQYFLIEKFGTNRITRFALEAPQTPLSGPFSTQDGDEGGQSNPYDVVVASPTKAYVLRYGSPTLWIVNPSATDEESYKIGEIDLSHYDSDGIPEMSAGLIHNGLLYIALQRLEAFAAVKPGYLAIIDTVTDEEIDTGTGTLPGIELPLRNPGQIVAEPAGNDLLVVGSGGFDGSFTPLYEGGIARLNPGTYSTTLLVDDGVSGNAPYGQIGTLALVSDTLGYFLGSDNEAPPYAETLFRFNPASTEAPQAVSGFVDLPLSDLAVDPLGRLWIGRSDDTAPGLTVLAPAGGTETVVVSLIDTVLLPQNIDFLIQP